VTERGSGRESTRRQSDVLDAIFDVVGDKPESQTLGKPSPFRASALEQMNLPTQVDNLLPITSRRSWVAVAAAALLIVAGLVYAAGVVQTFSVTVSGRVVAPPGLATAAAPTGAVLTSASVSEGDTVTAGQVLAEGVDDNGRPVRIASPIAGTIWQQVGFAGRVVHAGDMVATVLPPGSSATVLVAVQESDEARITPGLTVNVTSGETQTTGTVTAIDAAPEPSEVESARLGVPLTAGTSVYPTTITLAEPLEAGAGATAQIIISQKTLLQQLTGLGS